MPPIRTNDTQMEASTSATKQSNPTKNQSKRRRPQSDEQSATSGVSKIKASLRQTRRFLAKDKLAADVRVETERRLKALEAELAHAELARKERALATRYHKIKFFERQKVTRKISQTKKQLSSATDDKTKKKLTKVLRNLRVDLNYILHYPKLKKYISLFPPEARKGEPAPTTSEEDAAKTEQAREEVRSWVKSSMKKGELPQEPELHQPSDLQHKTTRKDSEVFGGLEKSMKSKGKTQPVQENPVDTIEQDEFFGEDDENGKSK